MICTEYGRVTALKVEKYDRENDTIKTIYYPQYEIVKYDTKFGEVTEKEFVSVMEEFTDELEAIKHAIKVRTKYLLDVVGLT